jgi:3-oxoacyl-[acyl-carrier protein] reductase
MSNQFTDKVVIVTAGGRGMGRTVVENFAREGASVMIGARTMSYAEETVARLRAEGLKVSAVQCDVTQRDAVADLVTAAVAEFGALDIVVNCAADIPIAPITALSDADFDTTIDSILRASFWLTKDAIPHLSKARQGGRLIFISSTSGTRTNFAGLSLYGAAKAGLDAFVNAIAIELGPQGITVNTINPGMIASDRLFTKMSVETQRELSSAYPIARVGTPQDIADLTLFLASNKASYITGEHIAIDGGACLSIGDVAARMRKHNP